MDKLSYRLSVVKKIVLTFVANRFNISNLFQLLPMKKVTPQKVREGPLDLFRKGLTV